MLAFVSSAVTTDTPQPTSSYAVDFVLNEEVDQRDQGSKEGACKQLPVL